MKRIAGLLCCMMLLLTACGGEKAVFEQVPKETAPELGQGDVRPQLPEATPAPVSTPTSAPVSTPTSVPVPTPTPTPEAPTLEEARALIQRANDALAPLLGDSPTEGEPVALDGVDGCWRKLSGYTTKAEIISDVKAVFGDWLATGFFNRCEDLLLQEANNAVYVRDDSRDILGHYYDMDLDTLVSRPDLTDFIFSDVAYTADGYGNGTPVQWEIGFEAENGDWKVNFYKCWDARKHSEEERESAVLIGDQLFSFWSEEVPEELGTPYNTETWDWKDDQFRTEYYEGFKVTFHRWTDSDNEAWWAWYTSVTRPGIPTTRGVEVGDTLREVLAAYPQFDIGEVVVTPRKGDDVTYLRGDSPNKGEYHSSMMYFYFDENFILKEIYLCYDLSN